MLSAVALVGSVEAATAPLLPDMLAVRDYAWSCARACGGPAGLDGVGAQVGDGGSRSQLVSRACQLELPHSFLQVMQESLRFMLMLETDNGVIRV